MSVSPLTILLVEGEKLMTSALNRFAANSKDVRVRVLGSKNKLQIMCLNDAPFYKNMLVFDNTRHDALNEMRHLRGI